MERLRLPGSRYGIFCLVRFTSFEPLCRLSKKCTACRRSRAPSDARPEPLPEQMSLAYSAVPVWVITRWKVFGQTNKQNISSMPLAAPRARVRLDRIAGPACFMFNKPHLPYSRSSAPTNQLTGRPADMQFPVSRA